MSKFRTNTFFDTNHRTRAIISRGLYIFYPILCGLKSRAVNITDNLCTKQGNSSIKYAVYNQEQAIMVRVRCSDFYDRQDHIS